jgi:hypothetical protein
VPAKSERQRRAMAADYERVKEGKAPRATKGMTQSERHDFMSRPTGGYKKASGKK